MLLLWTCPYLPKQNIIAWLTNVDLNGIISLKKIGVIAQLNSL